MPNSQALSYVIKMNKDASAIADGPIHEQLIKALNETYKKDIDPETGMSLETQALDALRYSNHYIAYQDLQKSKQNAEPDSTGIVYVIDNKNAGLTDVVNVVEIFEGLNNAQAENSALVIDNGEDQERSSACQEIIKVAQECGVALHYSIESYVQSLSK